MRKWWALPAALLGGAGGLLVGVLVGVLGVVVHRHAVWLGRWPLPWGAVLALATAVSIAVALRGRAPPLLGFLLGWTAPVLLALGEGPGGDFVLLSDLLGWAYLVASVLVAAVGLALGAAAGRQRDAADRQRDAAEPAGREGGREGRSAG